MQFPAPFFVIEGIQTGGPCLDLPDVTCYGALQVKGLKDQLSPAVSQLLVKEHWLGPCQLHYNTGGSGTEKANQLRPLRGDCAIKQSKRQTSPVRRKEKKGTMIHPTGCDVKYGHGVEAIR